MTATPDDDPELTAVWRTVTAARVAAGVFMAGFAIGILVGLGYVAVHVAEGRYGDAAAELGLIASFAVLGIAGPWLLAFRPFIAIYEGDIVVRNLLTVRIPHADITHVHPGRSGMVLVLRDRRVVTASAVQKAPLSEWLGRHTRADDVAAAIRHATGAGARVRHRRRRRG